MECTDVQALRPPFSPRAPQFAPQSNRDRGDPDPPFSAWEAGEPTSRVMFRTQTWPLLIKMATANFAAACAHKSQPPRMVTLPQQSSAVSKGRSAQNFSVRAQAGVNASRDR